jgi:S1-C subfamily serine protease
MRGGRGRLRPVSGGRPARLHTSAPTSNGVLTGLEAMQIVGINGLRAVSSGAHAGSHAGAHGALPARSTAPCTGSIGSIGGISTNGGISHESICSSSHGGAYGSGYSGSPIAQAFAACVKVYCTSVAPCYALPWVRGDESHTTGSGFAVVLPSGERALLAHAQVLENAALIQVRRGSAAQKYVAQVECAGYDVDVAVLQVADEQFWRGLPLLPLPDGLPAVMSEVLTAGFPQRDFPQGGEELATTRGVVNRILLGGTTRELAVQMDAPINPGNNGGPVLNTAGQLVGMACSGGHGTAHAGGYAIPPPVSRALLRSEPEP